LQSKRAIRGHTCPEAESEGRPIAVLLFSVVAIVPLIATSMHLFVLLIDLVLIDAGTRPLE